MKPTRTFLGLVILSIVLSCQSSSKDDTTKEPLVSWSQLIEFSHQEILAELSSMRRCRENAALTVESLFHPEIGDQPLVCEFRDPAYSDVRNHKITGVRFHRSSPVLVRIEPREPIPLSLTSLRTLGIDFEGTWEDFHYEDDIRPGRGIRLNRLDQSSAKNDILFIEAFGRDEDPQTLRNVWIWFNDEKGDLVDILEEELIEPSPTSETRESPQ